MNSYELIRKISKEIIDKIYEQRCKEELKEEKEEIKKHCESILGKFSLDYNLTYGNTVHKGNYFKIESRVKSNTSIEEKFIRKNEIFNICETFELDSLEKIQYKSDEIYEYFIRYEDIIGIKILGEVKQDVKSIYQLIKEKQEEFKKYEIEFKDIENQPVQMKNGLEIYNIKGLYKKKYGVEFQIKSRIESAWGDMEHVIFYKNHEYTPLKQSTHEIMNRAGSLLNEIDELLFSIRNSEKEYTGNSDEITFITEIYKTYQSKIKKLLHADYDFDLKKHSKILVHIYQTLFNNLTVIPIEFNHECLGNKYDVTEEIVSKYLKHRRKKFDLAILESLYCHWYCIANKKEVNYQNYLCGIKEYIDMYIEYIKQIYFEGEINKEAVEKLLLNVINEDVFLLSNKFSDIATYIKYLRDSLSDSELDQSSDVEINQILDWAVVHVGKKIFDNSDIDCNDLYEMENEFDVQQDVFIQFNKNLERMYEQETLNKINYKRYININKEILSKINTYEEV